MASLNKLQQHKLCVIEEYSIIKEVERKTDETKSTLYHNGTKAERAGNKEELREVAETYGVYKLLTDAPRWSTDGK